MQHELHTKETDFKINQLCEELQTKAPALTLTLTLSLTLGLGLTLDLTL